MIGFDAGSPLLMEAEARMVLVVAITTQYARRLCRIKSGDAGKCAELCGPSRA